MVETMVDMRGLLAPGTRQRYVLAGKSTITVLNPKTGTRFTYKIRQSNPERTLSTRPLHFVSVLTGSDNTSQYTYLGTIFPDRGFSRTGKTRFSSDAPSFVAFEWFAKHMEDERVEVWHEGSCGVCGRKLTVPESIASGIGPVCAGGF